MSTTGRAKRCYAIALLVLAASACGAKESVQSNGDGTSGGVTVVDGSGPVVSVAGSERSSASGGQASTSGPSSTGSGGPGSTGSVSGGAGPVGSGAGGKGTGSNGAGAGGGAANPATGSVGTPAPISQSISFPPVAGGWVYGETRTLAATASSGLGVTFGATGACQVKNAALGVVQASDVGECRVTVSQPGGPGVQAAAPVTQSTRIGQATPTIQFGDQSFEHPRHPFTIPLSATASGGATVQYRVPNDQQLCSLQGNALSVPDTQGLPEDCLVEAFVDGDPRFEPASATATFTITPTVVRFTDHSDATSDGTNATITVSLNRVWAIDIESSCDGSYDFKEGSSSYTISVGLPAGRPTPCSIIVQTSQPDAATTTDSVEVQVP